MMAAGAVPLGRWWDDYEDRGALDERELRSLAGDAARKLRNLARER